MATLVKWLAFSGAHKVDGTPVSTGTVRFYVPGSTGQEITIFADEAESEPISQPVTLDAAGKAVVYLNDQASILVQDSTGATVIITDDATSVSAEHTIIRNAGWSGSYPEGSTTVFGLGGKATLNNIVSRISDSIGTDALYRESLNADCIQRPVHDILHHCVRSRDYGAVGNGIVDDTTNLQKAINRAIAQGIPLYLENGTYLTTSLLTANGSIYIYGDGVEESIINNETSGGITIAATASGYVILRDFSVTVPVETDGPTAITVSSAESLEVTNVNAFGATGFNSSTVSGARYTNCQAQATSDSGGP